MTVKKWVSDNIPFLITLLLGTVAFYSTFQVLLYRVSQIEARVQDNSEKFENYVIPRELFEAEIRRLEEKIDILLDRR